jgi:hypothetical protein
MQSYTVALGDVIFIPFVKVDVSSKNDIYTKLFILACHWLLRQSSTAQD